jgi:hypothetical protein
MKGRLLCATYIFRTGMDMSPISPDTLFLQIEPCVMLPPGLVCGDLAVLPRSPPKPSYIEQARPMLNMVQYCVAGKSHVPPYPSILWVGTAQFIF